MTDIKDLSCLSKFFWEFWESNLSIVINNAPTRSHGGISGLQTKNVSDSMSTGTSTHSSFSSGNFFNQINPSSKCFFSPSWISLWMQRKETPHSTWVLQEEHLNWIWCLLLQGYFVRPQHAPIFCATVVIGLAQLTWLPGRGDGGWTVCFAEDELLCLIDVMYVQ